MYMYIYRRANSEEQADSGTHPRGTERNRDFDAVEEQRGTETPRGRPSFFLPCFLSLSLFVCSERHISTFFALSSDSIYRSKRWYTSLFLSSSAVRHPTYINMLGVAEDTCLCVFGRRPDDPWRQTPSMRFFGVATSRLRFGASRSSPENPLTNP